MNHYAHIKHRYENSLGDSNALFEGIISAAKEIGLDQALAHLETCVLEKRIAWAKMKIGDHKEILKPVEYGFRLFYETYLGVSVPDDGEIVAWSEQKIISRWWNSCPTLDACVQLGLDTREICKKAYHQPVQEFLVQINPGLRFERNYACIRPYTPYCEEILFLCEPASPRSNARLGQDADQTTVRLTNNDR